MSAQAKSWAAEGRGVTVNVVSLAATRTAMLDDPARAGTAPHMPPIGRFIQPEEVASLVAYLLSLAAAASLTGQDIAPCGGATSSTDAATTRRAPQSVPHIFQGALHGHPYPALKPLHAGPAALSVRYIDVDAMPWQPTRWPGIETK